MAYFTCKIGKNSVPRIFKLPNNAFGSKNKQKLTITISIFEDW